jgi:alpha-tubulin suppressor-like RCC1 family protein
MFTEIAAGWTHVCAIEFSGQTYCWGNNDLGQLGNSASMQTCGGGNFACSSSPVLVEGGREFVSLSASIRHTCGLDALGDAYCWGFGIGGQLGDGLRQNSFIPVAVAGGLKFSQLSASETGSVTCGLTVNAEAWCWGVNSNGEMGNGTTEASNVPTPVSTSLELISLSVSQAHACAVSVAGDALCWGNNSDGQLGVGSAGGNNGLTESLTPTLVLGGIQFNQVSVGSSHSCGLGTTGEVYCWGWSDLLGAGIADVYVSLPVQVDAGSNFVQLSAGSLQTCALDDVDGLYCWGLAFADDGSTQNRQSAVPILPGQEFVSVSVGSTHTCAIDPNGFAYCWGSNRWGQVGQPRSDP